MPRIAVMLAVVLLVLSGSASALEKERFSEARFQALQSQGAVVLIDIYATWCPTCAEQQKVLERYLQAHPDVPLHILEVNWDEDKQWVRAFRAPRQSTLILYRGEEQVWYAVAETREKAIFDAINAAAAEL